MVFKAVRPVQPVVVEVIVEPLVKFTVSMPVTVAAVGVAMAALLMTLKVSVPAPPLMASPVVQTAAPAISPAVMVSLPVVPVNESTPVVSRQVLQHRQHGAHGDQ